MAKGTEPFPPLNGSHEKEMKSAKITSVRRRKSSGLGGELPGDSDAPALATMASPPATPTESSRSASGKPQRRSKRRTLRRFFSKWKRLSLRHTWLMPLLLASFIVALYLVNPVPANPISAALFLSYPLPNAPGDDSPIQYGKGARDFAFVGFYTIVLSFTREFIMQRFLRPLAIRAGLKSRAKQSRFMEQFYTAIYFSLFGPFGLYVMSRTPVWYFNTVGMYEGFPHKTHEAIFKAYYLLQASYWTQQMIVLLLMLEAPRKDFKELVLHHFITLALVWCSYRFHFTYMGIAVYITMDVSDFFLATSKLLNYLDSPIVGPYFFLFMCVWGYLRHYINLKILWSIVNGEFSGIGDFTLNWDTQQYKCWISQYITFALLAALQFVNLIWWFYICRIAYRFVVYKDADDDRSEYEESGDESVGGEKEGKSYKDAVTNGSTSTPKVLVNGEEPTTPKRTTGLEEPGSIASRVRARKNKG